MITTVNEQINLPVQFSNRTSTSVRQGVFPFSWQRRVWQRQRFPSLWTQVLHEDQLLSASKIGHNKHKIKEIDFATPRIFFFIFQASVRLAFHISSRCALPTQNLGTSYNSCFRGQGVWNCFVPFLRGITVSKYSSGADSGFFLGEGAPLRNDLNLVSCFLFFFIWANYYLFQKAKGHLNGGWVRTPCTPLLDPPLLLGRLKNLALWQLSLRMCPRICITVPQEKLGGWTDILRLINSRIFVYYTPVATNLCGLLGKLLNFVVESPWKLEE